ncbi:MAG: peroxiredoxin family protein [Candidatus Hodarchaeota archaeon]
MMILGIDNVQSYVGVGETAPDFTLISVEGDSISLSDYLGQVVLLNFFQLT